MSTEESKPLPSAQPRPSNPFPQRRDQFRTVRLGENSTPLNPAVHSYLNRVQPGFFQQSGDPVAAHQMALQSLDNLRQQQALALSYFDSFLVFGALAATFAIFVLFMKRSVAEKGAHVSAEWA